MTQPAGSSPTWAAFRRRLLDQVERLLRTRDSESAPTAPGPPPPVPAALTAEGVLGPHTALVRRIRVAYGYPDNDFRQHLLAPITALAAWLHTLPGPPGGGYERRGGAIEQALTNCLFSLQAADGRTFDACHTETSSPHDTQRWRLACALGGLFASLPETLARIEVVSEDGRVWPSIGVPLLDWLASLGGAYKYHYRWALARKCSSGSSVYAAARCLGPDVMSFLAGADARIAADLIGCIAGSNHPAGQVSEVVNRIAATVAARCPHDAIALSPDLIAGTLKRLLSTSDWLPNAPGGHVWHDAHGLYLLWPDAATKLREALPLGIRNVGTVASNDELLQRLADAGIVHGAPSPLVHIRPPGSAAPRSAVRIAEPDRVLGDVGRRAAPLDLSPTVPISDVIADEDGEAAKAGEPARARDSTAAESDAAHSVVTGSQQTLDFAAPLHDVDGTAAQSLPASEPRLSMDTSKIANPRIREVVDSVIARLDQSFDDMLAKIVPDGVFVALTEFVGQHGDGASVVRALCDAQLLAADSAAPDRRVFSETMEGVSLMGVVLRASIFDGYTEWTDRWQAKADLGS